MGCSCKQSAHILEASCTDGVGGDCDGDAADLLVVFLDDHDDET